MAGTLVSGPAGAGKSAQVKVIVDAADEPTIVADFSRIWQAISGVERDQDGKLPERDDSWNWILPLTEFLRRAAIDEARHRGIAIVGTTSDGSPETRQSLMDRIGTDDERIVDPGESVVEDRLRDRRTGRLSRSCRRAVNRWYRRYRPRIGRRR